MLPVLQSSNYLEHGYLTIGEICSSLLIIEFFTMKSIGVFLLRILSSFPHVTWYMFQGLLEARRELRPTLLKPHDRLRDIIFLDLALDSTVRTAVERGLEDLTNSGPKVPHFSMLVRSREEIPYFTRSCSIFMLFLLVDFSTHDPRGICRRTLLSLLAWCWRT